jgi:hypothetical protein
VAAGCLAEVDADGVGYPFEINVEAQQTGASGARQRWRSGNRPFAERLAG